MKRSAATAQNVLVMNKNGSPEASDSLYFPVSPMLVFPETTPDFRIFLKQGGRYVLYTREQQRFTEKHRRNLHEIGVNTLYVLAAQRKLYETYMEDNLGAILNDSAIPVQSRAHIFLDASSSIVEQVFNQRMTAMVSPRGYERIKKLVKQSAEFLSKTGSLKHVVKLIDHNYKTYNHCMHVFVYSQAILNTLNLRQSQIVQCGIGAMLHDVGKLMIPNEIIEKPAKLEPEEFEEMKRHPLHGVALCSGVNIGKEALNAVLFHHERMDGKGYPSRLAGENIPVPVRAVTICDVYDALTSDRPYANAITPFEALSIMREEMRDAFDMAMFKRLVMVLSGIDVV